MSDIRYDLHIFHSLRRISQAVDIQSKKLSAKHQITGQQLVCLYLLAQESPLTVKAIGEKIYISSGTLVGILDRLESKGLVLRAQNLQDRRKLNVMITDKGRELVNNTPNPLQEMLYDSLSPLPEMEKATLAFSLEKIANMLQTSKPGDNT